MKFAKLSSLAVFASSGAMVVALALGSAQTALAQGPGGPGFRRPSIDAQAFNACTTTDYASIVAKALNMNLVDIRKGIVAGQQLQAIAASANGDMQAALTAYEAARKTDIDQAVKDGVMTQDEATALEATPPAPGTPGGPGNAGGPGNGGGNGGGNGTPDNGGPRRGQGGFGQALAAAFPDISTVNFLLQQAAGGQGGAAATQPAPGNAGGPGGPGGRGGPGGFGGFGGLGGGLFNRVKQYAVAATALNIKCADLVKTLITPPGKSVSDVAKAQNIDPNTVSAALSKAYKDALAQDVTDGILTQAQADQLGPQVDKAVSTFVANPLPMGPQGTPPAPAA